MIFEVFVPAGRRKNDAKVGKTLLVRSHSYYTVRDAVRGTHSDISPPREGDFPGQRIFNLPEEVEQLQAALY